MLCFIDKIELDSILEAGYLKGILTQEAGACDPIPGEPLQCSLASLIACGDSGDHGC